MFLSGIIWLVDSLTAARKRKAAVEALYDKMLKPPQSAINAVAEEPIYVDYAKSFFPILLFIVVMRSFLWEPFQIPSGSMKPTLIEGDFILVNKFDYGLRLPVTSKKVVEIGSPQRGDVVVFKAPDTGEDFIKRVIGIPGDTILYTKEKDLYIKPACAKDVAKENCSSMIKIEKVLVEGPGYIDKSPNSNYGELNDEYVENLFGVKHGILNNPNRPQYSINRRREDSVFVVPENRYFVMGDNRDNSKDSRYWVTTHFVPEESLVGHAVSIWMHFEFGFTNPYFSWIPTGVDFGRIGAIK